jgi:uncharacterized protein (DUF885 family)
MYLTGCDAIHDLRASLRALQGKRFNLRDFHDQFLSHGSIPVALIAKAMLEDEDQITPGTRIMDQQNTDFSAA